MKSKLLTLVLSFAVLLLTDPGKLTVLGVLTANSNSISAIYYLGGIGAVPASVRKAAETAAGIRQGNRKHALSRLGIAVRLLRIEHRLMG